MKTCKSCNERATCRQLCPDMEQQANNNNPLREQLITPDIIEDMQHNNYNDALSEMIEDKRNRDANRLEIIRAIPDYRIRLVAAGILANIPQREIAKIINQSQSTISLIYRRVTY